MAEDRVKVNQYGMPSFNTRDLIIRDDIMVKAKELADLIGTSEEVQHFKQAELKIREHERVQGLIQKMKKKQKKSLRSNRFKIKKWLKKLNVKLRSFRTKLTIFLW